MQGGMKCRSVSAFAPLPLTVRNVGGICSDQRGDVGIAPYATRRDVSFIIVGADAHVGPSVIGIVLQIPRLPTGKGFQNLGFGALLVTFPAREK